MTFHGIMEIAGALFVMMGIPFILMMLINHWIFKRGNPFTKILFWPVWLGMLPFRLFFKLVKMLFVGTADMTANAVVKKVAKRS